LNKVNQFVLFCVDVKKFIVLVFIYFISDLVHHLECGILLSFTVLLLIGVKQFVLVNVMRL